MHETPVAISLTRKTKHDEDLRQITPAALRARLWSITKTAVILGDLSRRQVDRLIAAGALKTKMLGSRRMVIGQSLHDFMENLPSGDPGEDAA